MNNISSKDQLRWVILLLAIAVILPTVCLLYFMTRAAENDRLAFRQRMANNYDNRFRQLTKDQLGFDKIDLELSSNEGFIVYDSNGIIAFPVSDDYDLGESSVLFDNAFQLEYIDNDPNKAITEYRQIKKNTDNNDLSVKADMSILRCLNKLDRLDEAITQAKSIIEKYDDSTIHIRSQKGHAYILLMDLYKLKTDDSVEVLTNALDYFMRGFSDNELPYLVRSLRSDLYVPSSLQLLALNRLFEYTEEKHGRKYKRAVTLAGQLETSLRLSSELLKPDFVIPGKTNVFFRPKTKGQFYGRYSTRKGYTFLSLYSKKRVAGWFDEVLNEIQDEMVFCRIYDEKDDFLAGTPEVKAGSEYNIGDKFATVELESYLSGFKAELYFYNGVFTEAAERQRLIYIWTGILVISLILIVSGLAGKAILRQAKLNTLKNDFIATVTHELKTPLASMRVLVDTLLEGNYNDRQQAMEYLQLISKENKRLTGLIDNFLTFSRMERNKQAFEIIATSPAEIAKDAAFALKTKFAQGNCDFTMNIPDNLADIYADHDAMVTVLVNLLDNAYKYSGDDKQIELSLYEQESGVYFKVKDNGKGMSLRVTRKIFERFYQADSRLARSTEGCGLGLSIVKFIVDAHKGNIEVQSKPDKGTEFTVSIQIV